MNPILNGIIGLAVADALGVPVEFKDRQTLARNPVISMRAYGTYNQPAGTWSDDTSMTLCLVDSLLKGLDYSDLMEKFIKWYDRGEYTAFGEAFDIGITTSESLLRFKRGVDPLECGGSKEGDNGNGSLMRILPALFHLESIYGEDFGEIDEAFEIIHNISALTHAHKRSQMACGIYISIASSITKETGLNTAIDRGINEAMNYYKEKDSFAEEFTYFNRIVEKDFAEQTSESIKSSGYVIDTLEAAIWCLLTTNSYKECVLNAVNLGEDTDTVAAVAGGLAGMHYGYENIPEEWLTTLVKREYIEDLCEQLYVSMD